MDAYVSGECGRAFFIEGNDAFLLELDAPDDLIQIPIGFAWASLRNAGVVVELKSSSKKAALELLENEWKCDRALRLILILLDEEEYTETKRIAADALSDFFKSPSILEFVKRRLYARPLPENADVTAAIEMVNGYLRDFLQSLADAQLAIGQHRLAWDELTSDIFADAAARQRIEAYLIESGAFSELVEAGENAPAVNQLVFRCLQDLKDERNFRNIISTWTRRTSRSKMKRLTADLAQNDETEKPWELDLDTASMQKDSHEAFENVQKQQEGIITQLRKGNLRAARKFTDELVQSQLKSGVPAYVAKSLCNLSQHAKSLGLHSLQLEWTKRAIDFAPNDGWTYGQTADALIFFSRFDEALEYLEFAEKLGHRPFAITGRARVLKAQARLDEALAAFVDAESQLVGQEGEDFAWIGHAEVLRDMWRFDESLRVYEQAVEKFPESSVLHCGRAAVLTDMGRLDAALTAYDETVRNFGEEIVSLNGRSEVLRQMGQLEEALRACNSVIESFPTDPVAYCLQAEILRLRGDLEGAQAVYADVKANFPYLSVAYSGFAEVLKERHQYLDALAAYDDAIRRFPYESRVHNGRASVLKMNGQYEDALGAYAENVRQFPYDLVALNGRADLLKELGNFDGAVKLYDQIISHWPGFISARHAKAAILAVRGRYDEAEELLPKHPPETRDEWIGSHVRGMIWLRRGDIQSAIDHFSKGVLAVPYARERNYFETALALAHLQCKQFARAADLVERTSGPMANVLKLHAFAAADRRREAQIAYKRIEVRCPPKIVDLRDELASRYRFLSKPPRHNDNWIFQQECAGMLVLTAA